MRESGKLIVHLTDAHVINLIKCKTNGSDPNEILFELVDNFFMTLPR